MLALMCYSANLLKVSNLGHYSLPSCCCIKTVDFYKVHHSVVHSYLKSLYLLFKNILKIEA